MQMHSHVPAAGWQAACFSLGHREPKSHPTRAGTLWHKRNVGGAFETPSLLMERGREGPGDGQVPATLRVPRCCCRLKSLRVMRNLIVSLNYMQLILMQLQTFKLNVPLPLSCCHLAHSLPGTVLPTAQAASLCRHPELGVWSLGLQQRGAHGTEGPAVVASASALAASLFMRKAAAEAWPRADGAEEE